MPGSVQFERRFLRLCFWWST